MRVSRSLPAILAALGMAACGGGEPPADEVPATEVAAAPASPCFVSNGSVDEARARPSPLSEAIFSVGSFTGTVCWGAPSASGRAIMGGLVPFGEIWRLGANEATAIHLTSAGLVGGVQLEAGSYSLYAIPGETEWTFFINTNVNRWGIPVDEAVRGTEVGSFTAAVEALGAPVETLTFRFEAGADAASGALILEWENTGVRIPVADAAAPTGA